MSTKSNTIRRNILIGTLFVSMLSILLSGFGFNLLTRYMRNMTENSFSEIGKGVSNVSNESLDVVAIDTMEKGGFDAYKKILSILMTNAVILKEISNFTGEIYDGHLSGNGTALPPAKENNGKPSLQLILAPGLSYEDEDLMREADKYAMLEIVLKSNLINYRQVESEKVFLINGMSFICDRHSALNVDKNGQPIQIDYLAKKRYKSVINSIDGEFFFLKNPYGRGNMIELCYPIETEGESAGVCVIDIPMTRIEESFETFVGNGSEMDYSLFLKDKLIFSTRTYGGLRYNPKNLYSWKKKVPVELKDTILNLKKAKKNSFVSTLDENLVNFGFEYDPDFKFTMLCYQDKNARLALTAHLAHSIHDISDSGLLIISRFIMLCGILFALFSMWLLYLSVKKSTNISDETTAPIRALDAEVDTLKGDDLNFVWNEDAPYEIEALAMAFKEQSIKLKNYIADMTKLSTQQERIRAELEVAKRIQQSALPKESLRGEGFEVFTKLRAADEVCGDFFDFFLIDEDHLCIVIADVAGRGVPAALFMMMAKLFIAEVASDGGSPQDICYEVNQKLCENNEEAMYLSAWLGILEISSGRVHAVNAGHENPILQDESGRFYLLEDRHSFILGGLKDADYEEYEFYLDNGRHLVLFTDTVDKAGKHFAENQMVASLNRDPKAEGEQLLENIFADMNKFFEGSIVDDDIAVVCVKRK